MTVSNGHEQAYAHPARLLVRQDGDDRECSVCTRPVIGFGPTLRHAGEAFRPTAPTLADSKAFHLAERLAVNALEELPAPSADITDRDRARAVVEKLYAAGLLDTRRRRRTRPRAAA